MRLIHRKEPIRLACRLLTCKCRAAASSRKLDRAAPAYIDVRVSVADERRAAIKYPTAPAATSADRASTSPDSAASARTPCMRTWGADYSQLTCARMGQLQTSDEPLQAHGARPAVRERTLHHAPRTWVGSAAQTRKRTRSTMQSESPRFSPPHAAQTASHAARLATASVAIVTTSVSTPREHALVKEGGDQNLCPLLPDRLQRRRTAREAAGSLRPQGIAALPHSVLPVQRLSRRRLQQ